MIVKRVLDKLAQIDPIFIGAKLRKTGSSMSGVKIGLPHEADYLLEIHPEKSYSRQSKFGNYYDHLQLFIALEEIMSNHVYEMIKDLTHWVIHGIKLYYSIDCVCIVMQCKSSENEDVGVTVDIVPVSMMTTTHDKFDEKSAAYLPLSLKQYAEKGDLYRLQTNDICDTGLIENIIVDDLPKGKKRAFRVTKLLISNFVCSGIPFHFVNTIDEDIRKKLYGRRPCISSYILRVIFLRLLTHVHGTDADQHLTDGVLVLCLLDILKELHTRLQKWMHVPLMHPFIEGRGACAHHLFDLPKIDNFMLELKTGLVDPIHAVEQFHLLNDKSNIN